MTWIYAVIDWKGQAPGSLEARKAGCSCAVMDNHHGRGRGGDGQKYGWFVSGDCPVHGSPDKPKSRCMTS